MLFRWDWQGEMGEVRGERGRGVGDYMLIA